MSLTVASPAAAQGMMNPKDVSGIPLPVADVPVGTVTVRVVRGTMANNLSGVTIELVINGKPRQMTTDATGRVQVSDLATGTRLKATAIVDGQRIESQDITVGASGLRVLLAADDPNAAAAPSEGGPVAAPVGPAAVRGAVTFGAETRVVAQFSNEQLNIFYALQIVNAAQTPVDIGGPLTIELPREARAASILEGSSPKATANGAHVIITGPFAPGTTQVDIGFQLPVASDTVSLVQRWPAALDQVLVLLPKEGGLDMSSPQAPTKQEMQSNGVPVVVGMGPGLAAGETLSVEITGLPYHPRWPRYTALALAGMLLTLGIGAAFRPARGTAEA
jgi:hypothetical protein